MPLRPLLLQQVRKFQTLLTCQAVLVLWYRLLTYWSTSNTSQHCSTVHKAKFTSYYYKNRWRLEWVFQYSCKVIKGFLIKSCGSSARLGCLFWTCHFLRALPEDHYEALLLRRNYSPLCLCVYVCIYVLFCTNNLAVWTFWCLLLCLLLSLVKDSFPRV